MTEHERIGDRLEHAIEGRTDVEGELERGEAGRPQQASLRRTPLLIEAARKRSGAMSQHELSEELKEISARLRAIEAGRAAPASPPRAEPQRSRVATAPESE